ncbi:hypothetical protein MJO29_006699 [Puccinia striiformis f. sp. tritici]|nr:hypothetical protein MJO29_006699 [Puccinia striiformis f. sp. tritici]
MPRSRKRRRQGSGAQPNQDEPNSNDEDEGPASTAPSAAPVEDEETNDQRLEHATTQYQNRISAAYASYKTPRLSNQLDKSKRRMIAWQCKTCLKDINQPANDRSCSNLLTHAGRCELKHSKASKNKTLALVGILGTGDIDPREVLQQCAIWCAEGAKPFSALQEESFQRLLHPTIVKHLPSRKMVSKAIHILYMCVQEQFLQEFMTHEGAIYLGVDAWQTSNGFDVIGVVIYRLLNDGKGKFYSSAMPLDFVQLKQSHTGKYLARMVQYIVEKFGIEHQICGIVSDNAANNCTMIEELEQLNWKRFSGEPQWIRCFTHILNLIVKAILRPFGRKKNPDSVDLEESDEEEEAQDLIDRFHNDEEADDSDSDDGEDGVPPERDDAELGEDDELTIEDLQDLEEEEDSDVYTSALCRRSLAKFRGIATKLNKSPNSKARFIELCQEHQCQKPHYIERDVPTRWNSTYKQLASIVRCEDAIIIWQRDKNFGTKRNVHLTQADLDLAQDLVKLLERFYELLKLPVTLHCPRNSNSISRISFPLDSKDATRLRLNQTVQFMSSTEDQQTKPNTTDTLIIESPQMDSLTSSIVQSCIKALPLLTIDNFSAWKSQILTIFEMLEVKDVFTLGKGVLSKKTELLIRGMILTKLDRLTISSVVNHSNNDDVLKIWASIIHEFASTDAANKQRIWASFSYMQFNDSDIPGFINQVKSFLEKMHEVGIVVDTEIVALEIVKKFPNTTEMTVIKTSLEHSGVLMTPAVVLEHLKRHSNNVASSSLANQSQVSLFTDASGRCKHKAHNTLANHPEARCWKLYPHLRPAFPPRPSGNSGSSAHMTSDLNLFQTIKLKDEGIVRTSSGSESLKIKGIGSIILTNEYGSFTLNNVLFVPDIVVNLLSVRCLVVDGFKINFDKYEFTISKNNTVSMRGRYLGNLPSLEFNNQRCLLSSGEFLHKSMSHVSYHRLRHKLGIPIRNPKSCEACAVSKITKGSFHSRHSTASMPFEEIHLDLVGPISPSSREGHKYFLTVVDSCTRFCSAIPIKKKSDVPDTIIQAVNLEAKRIGYHPTVLHSDRGSEFINNQLIEYCNLHSIRTRQSDAYTPQQNGLAERFNRTVLESLRAVLKDSGLRRDLWNEVVKSCSLILNQIPAHKSKKSPYELFKNRSIPLNFFKPIGNRLSYLIEPQITGSKLSPKGELGKLIGYNEELRSYRILSDNGRIIDTKSVQFLDHPSTSGASDNNEVLSVMEENVQAPSSTSDPVEIEDYESALEESPQSDDSSDTQSESTTKDESEVVNSLIPEPRSLRDRTSKVKPAKYSYLTGDPASFRAAMKSQNKLEWSSAADEELENIEGHNVWDNMWDQPASFLRTVWVFRTKPATLSSVERKKGRLCIQGFLQIPGQDYGETFAPTGKFTTLLILLLFAIDCKLPIRQFDVKSAFLFAPLDEEIYIKTPEGSKRTAPFLKLKKSLYGLKQAPMNWYKTLISWFSDINFKQSDADPCLFIHSEKTSYIFFHVDDLIVAGNVDLFEKLFLKQFPNSSAHVPDTLLGMELVYDNLSVKLSQKKLIEKGLELAGIQECHPVKTPLSVGVQLFQATDQEKADFSKLKINYRSHTGILNFLACRTRPDLAPAVSILSSFNESPGINHWRQVIHCWKYLAGTIDLSLTLRPDPEDHTNAVQHYTDATWADDLETRLSRSGSICFWKACPIAWNSKKQRNITLSSTEAELNALSDGVQESLWIKFLVEELWDTKLEPSNFHIDNQGLLEKIKNFGSNSKTKHLDIKMKWLRDLYSKNEITVKLIPSHEMIADALTKASSSESLNTLKERCFMKFKLDLQNQFPTRHRSTLKIVIPVIVLSEFTLQLLTGASTRVAEVVVWIDQITADLSTVVANDKDHFPPALRNACRAGLQITNKYYSLTNCSPIYRIAMVLHPSFKDEYFKLAKWPQSWVDEAITLTRQMYERWYKPKPCEAAKTPKKGPRKAQTGVLAGLGAAAIARSAESLSDPIDIWLSGGLVLDERAPVNGLRWWIEQKCSGNTLHGLLSMALDVMSCPATTVDVERKRDDQTSCSP